MSERRLFTSSSVLRGHPDKLCDRISDALVDAHLTVDTRALIRAEAAAAGQVIFVTTDARLDGDVDVNGVVRRTLMETGYERSDLDHERCTILTQSSVMTPPWARDRQDADDLPAGEQTTVFGYACSETPELMPLPIRVAHRIEGRLDELVSSGKVPGLAPDGSVQVTVEYRDDKPARIDAIVLQVVHRGDQRKLREAVDHLVLAPVFEGRPVRPDDQTRIIVNAEGSSGVAGPARNAGHTGRKQAADTYGGAARHGDGALSGKDPSRLDRCAAYAARHAAANVVAAGLATECELMLSYAIGEAEPTTVFARTFGRGTLSNERLSAVVREHFDFRPAVIARRFGLWELPRQRGGRFYRQLATGGQVGRPDLDLPWERLDTVDALRNAAD
ncbi:MAG: methionine adenosyltransferase [Chloroflexota bacterium]